MCYHLLFIVIFHSNNLFHSVIKLLHKGLYIQSRPNDGLPLADSLHKHELVILPLSQFLLFFLTKKTKLLHKFHFNQMIDCYTNFVLWSIKIIKFTKHWNNLENLPQGQSIKKYHLLQLFKSLHINLLKDLAVTENTLNAKIKQHRNLVYLYCQHVEQEKTLIEGNLCKFEGRHCSLITTYNTLLYLYTRLGNTL